MKKEVVKHFIFFLTNTGENIYLVFISYFSPIILVSFHSYVFSFCFLFPFLIIYLFFSFSCFSFSFSCSFFSSLLMISLYLSQLLRNYGQIVLVCEINIPQESRKKVLFLVARPLRFYPPPIELSGHIFRIFFSSIKKSYFFLVVLPLKINFFCGFPKTRGQ